MSGNENTNQSILVVEDEKHLAVGIKFNLEAEGYRVHLAEDGRLAWEILSTGADRFDLLILDIMLPGMSGYSLCQKLREAGHTLPVLILSARSLAEDKARGFDVGANQYLVKPFELDELISRVRNLLALGPVQTGGPPRRGSESENDADQVVFGDCTVDFSNYSITRESQTSRLTALQLKTLKHLIRNEGRVVSRKELLETVWEMPGNAQTRAPDQVIRQLRKLIESDTARPVHLLTLRDAGYMFVGSSESTASDDSNKPSPQ